MDLATCYCLHDDHWFLETSIDSLKEVGPVVCFVSKRAWNGSEGSWERAVEVAEHAGAEVVLGDWPDESLHRRTALAEMKRRGYKHIFIPDGDEVPEPKLIEALVKIAKEDLADVVRVRMDTYWRDAEHVIRPREELAPILLLDCQKSEHQHIREYSGERVLLLGPEYGVLHHLSYAGPDERIERKISTWGHRHEVAKEWFNRSWKGWEADPLLRDLHPTHPHVYGSVERIEKPQILAKVPNWREDTVEVKKNWPKVSVVIPLHGGPEDIAQCLDSLAKLRHLIHETIVVDDVSPDNAAEVSNGYEFVILLKNETNLGFAGTCNKGFEASTGSVILFLNSDTLVPRAGLIRLIESLMESGTIGAAGPLSNNVGYYQRIDPTYTSLDNLASFAEDLALSQRQDRDVEMLVGFALAVRRSVLEEVGLFDERFGRGMFEDTDLCYRLSRAGYRLRLANKAYVHHWGSRSLTRSIANPEELLHKNGQAYRSKWQRELETGYASHLPGFGMGQGLPKFNPDRHPDKLGTEIARLKNQAKISLCMIVKNEERVLAACLESAKPFFSQMIVVDTGSTDRTVEIAKEHGAEVYEIPWSDSFAEARNESLKYAKGDWVFWMDADDTLPFAAGENILKAAIHSPKQFAGYIVPVQFVEDGPGAGTRVDHVKLFRNKKDIQFEGRIHEQILSSLRKHGDIARIDAHVLHSGYDTSVKGQKKKRERDWHLLGLDLEERPTHPFVLFNIGMTHHFSDDHAEAIDWLKKSIEHSGETDSHLRKAWSMMGVSYRQLNLLDEAEATFREGLSKVGEDPELSFQLAMTLTAKEQHVEAIKLYEAMPTAIDDHFSSVDIGILTFKRLHNLATAKFSSGDYRGAREAWLEAHKINPNFVHSLIALTEAALTVGDYRTAQEALSAWLQVEGPSLDWCEQRARLADESGEAGGALGTLNHLVPQMPNSAGPRLMLARKLLALEHVDAAIPHLQVLERMGVAEAAFLLSIACLQRGDVQTALLLTERAVQLNPDHQQSRDQLGKLQAMLDVDIPSILKPDEQRKLLTSPHAGKLKEASKRFSVVIVTYNSEKWIERCLDSVLPTLAEEDEVIVVDNASVDGTTKIVSGLKNKQVTLIKNKENLGYSQAGNAGLLKSKGAVLVLLNPDTVVSPNWLLGMSEKLTDGVGAVGPVSDAISGQQFVGHYLRPGVRATPESLSELFQSEYAGKSVETKFVVGMCVMLPRAVLNAFGLLDEAMVLGADDLELSWRLRMLGLKLKIALDVFVQHVGHASFETRPKEETAKLIKASDEALVLKLEQFYGKTLPGSNQLWGNPIFDETLSRR